jgi:hypothetical protein
MHVQKWGGDTLGLPHRTLNMLGYDFNHLPVEMDYEKDALWVSFFTPGETRARDPFITSVAWRGGLDSLGE